MKKPLNYKRMFDIAVSAVLLSILFIPLLIVGLLVRMDGGSIFYKSPRVGYGGKIFKAFKFRSMVPRADDSLTTLIERDDAVAEEWSEQFKIEGDPRVTKLGAVLRALSIDELPQLINVLKGEMSLVGPRPILVEEVDAYTSSSESFELYCQCQPGLTGLWQVNGRSNTSYKTRVNMNNYYARNWSFWLDLKILFKTPSVVFRRVGAR